MKSLGNFKLVKTHEEDTAVRAVSPPSMFLYGSIRGTSLEASGEVFVFPHLLPMSGESGDARCAFRAEGVNVSSSGAREETGNCCHEEHFASRWAATAAECALYDWR